MQSASGQQQKKSSNPSDFLRRILGKPVVVKLNSGVLYKGVLACLDGFMNIAMEQTEEYVEGNLTSKIGDCFIRGNNETKKKLKFKWSLDGRSYSAKNNYSVSTFHCGYETILVVAFEPVYGSWMNSIMF